MDQDKIKNKAEEMAGSAKRKAGEHSDDEELRSEGQKDEATAKGKQAGDKAKDAAQDTMENLKEKARGAFNR